MYCKLFIIGRSSDKPELRVTAGGKYSARIGLAVDHYTNEGKKTIWMNVTVFGSEAEKCAKYLEKGSRIFVEGQLNPDPETMRPKVYKNKDGDMVASYDIIGNKVLFIGGQHENERKAN